jgi:hypothetical protein
MKDSLDVVEAVPTFGKNAEPEIDLCVCPETHHLSCKESSEALLSKDTQNSSKITGISDRFL